MTAKPLVVHVIYRLDVGGLETLMIECINRMPPERYRHAIVCLTTSSAFEKKITAPDVAVYSLHKAPGLSLGTHIEFFKLVRRLKPAVVHTYNLAAIEYHLMAAMAGVPARLHAEHGRDAGDPHGQNRKHNLLRRLISPLIHRFVPVSVDLQSWLQHVVQIPANKLQLVPNGVDTDRFAAQRDADLHRNPLPFPADSIVLGTVGRLQAVKDHQCLIDAFAHLRELLPMLAPRLRLAIIGDGPCSAALHQRVQALGLQDVVWLPGARDDIALLMQHFDLFVMSSIAEGTPVTILEAMASGIPIVATRVGGIPEVVQPGVDGQLVAAKDPRALAAAVASYCTDPAIARQHGANGRTKVEAHFSIKTTVAAYLALYDKLLRPT